MSAQDISIIIHGFGQVGHLVKKAIEEDDHATVSAIVDATDPGANHESINSTPIDTADVIIDFSHKEGPLSIVRHVAQTRPDVAILVGTTGWEEDLEEVKKIIEEKNLRFLTAPNFGIGTNLYFKIIEYAASLFDAISSTYRFDPSITETHHIHKKDAPSGTAKKIADIILQNSSTKNKIMLGKNTDIDELDNLYIESIREGEVIGVHTAKFDAGSEYVEIIHTARDRAIYPKGALLAAHWLVGQKPGFYTFDDYLEAEIYSRIKKIV